jgi:signal transduction histidine kinase
MESTERARSALQLIAEGVTELAGFDVAAISVVRHGILHVAAVAGNDSAREELVGLRTPVAALLAELEHAEDWGLLKFVPYEREAGNLDGYSWFPDIDVSDEPEAWHPHDLLCALLYDDGGALRGVLSIDVPRNGRRPGPDQQRILQLYARQAARAVITALERNDYAHGLAQERAVAEYRAQLMDVLSHEVQNPLTVILQNAELLLTEDHHDELTVRGLEAIQRGARRIEHMGRDLLVLARVGRPDRPLEDVIDLVDLSRGVVELMELEAVRRGVEVEVETDQPELLVLGDVQDLDAVVSNLVTNAVKYSEAGGRVRVRLRRCEATADGAEAVIEVEDEGVGIGEQDRLRVFEEFFRSPDPRVRERPGTGLGLAIADRAVARHGGRIEVASTPGGPTRFMVALPLLTPYSDSSAD